MKKVTAYLLLPFLLFGAQSEAQIAPLVKKGVTRAVIIGVSVYQNPRIPALQFADADATAFADYLQSKAGGSIPPDRIKLLTNSNATQGMMASALTWLMEESKDGDQAIIYFSGHGDMETQTIMNYGFLLTYDAPASTYMAGGAFPVNYLQAIVQTLSTKQNVQVMMVIDACHAGKLAGSATGGTQATAKVLSDQFANEVKLMSCQPNEFSQEGRQWGGGHGVFTYYLIDGLTGMADKNNDRSVNLLEIQRYLEDNVAQAAAPQSQIPMVSGNKGLVIAKVDAAQLNALVELRKNQQIAGVGSAVVSRSPVPVSGDSATMALYRQFLTAMSQKHLLYPSEGSAYAIYLQIRDKPAMRPYCKDMRLNLAASLQEEAQKAINNYLTANPQEMRRRWAYDTTYAHYPEYLDRAAEILGPDHFMYQEIKARQAYFEGLNLRMKAEQTQNTELFAEAEVLQQKVLQLEPNAAYAMNELGLLARRNMDYNKSVDYFNAAIAQSPTWVVPITNLCGSYGDLGELQKSLDACRLAISIDSSYASAHFKLGLTYMDLSDNDAAEKEFLLAAPQFAESYFKLGVVYYLEHKLDSAKTMWEESTRRLPEFAPAFKNLGDLAAETGNPDAALAWYDKAIAINAGYGTAFFGKCLVLAAKKQSDQALNALQAALSNNFRDAAQINTAPELEALRKTPAFLDLYRQYFGN